MIAKFSVGNYLSFKEPCSMSLEATALKEHKENIFVSISKAGFRIVKSAAIHGANSSGKSNFIKAFNFMKYWILNSFNESNRITEIPVQPFLLRIDTEKQPSFFEVVFYVADIKYRYGFELNKKSIHSEWLMYSEPKKREQHYFIRTGQDITFNNSWKRTLTKQIDPLIPYVKQRVLFISILSQFNIEIGTTIIDWFNKNIYGFDFGSEEFINKAASDLSDQEYFIIIHQLIKEANLGFSTVKQTIDDRNDFKSFALSDATTEFQVQTKHNIYDNSGKIFKEVYFDLRKQESSGSQKFFALAGALIKAIRERQILWIDELDSKFHPILFETIIKFFNSNKYNHKGAQLIFSSHNTHLLKEKLLRRDQIFTMNKNEFGESYLKSIHSDEASVRIDASIEKDYLSGKYGGLPKIDPDGFQLDLF